MTQFFAISNLVVGIGFFLGVALLVVAVVAQRYVDCRRDPQRFLGRLADRLVGPTVGQELVAALEVSDAALRDALRRLTPEQRAAVGIWLRNGQTGLSSRQRDQLLVAWQAVEQEGGE